MSLSLPQLLRCFLLALLATNVCMIEERVDLKTNVQAINLAPIKTQLEKLQEKYNELVNADEWDGPLAGELIDSLRCATDPTVRLQVGLRGLVDGVEYAVLAQKKDSNNFETTCGWVGIKAVSNHEFIAVSCDLPPPTDFARYTVQVWVYKVSDPGDERLADENALLDYRAFREVQTSSFCDVTSRFVIQARAPGAGPVVTADSSSRIRAWRARRDRPPHPPPPASGTSSADNVDAAGVWYGGLLPIAAELAVDEAEELAAKLGGKAFGALAQDDVSNEIHVLQGIGEPDLECEHDQAETGGQDAERSEEFEEFLKRGLSPLSASVLVPLPNGSLVPWAVKKGDCFREAAEAFKRHHRQDSDSPHADYHYAPADYHFILIRNEITKLAVLGSSEGVCLSSPNFRRLSRGRLRSRLSPNLERLISQFVFQGPLHLHKDNEVQRQDRLLAVMRDPATGMGIYPHPLCKAPCNWDAEMHKCSTASVTFSDFTARIRHMCKSKRGSWRESAMSDADRDRGGEEVVGILTSALKVLEVGGKMLGARSQEMSGRRSIGHVVRISAPFSDVCYAYLFASAAFIYSWALPDLPPQSAGQWGGGEEESCAEMFGQELHNVLSVLSLAWIVLKALPQETRELPEGNPYGVSLLDVVGEYQRRMVAYTACVSPARRRQLDHLLPIKYAMPEPLPQGQYPLEAMMLEHLEPDGNSILGVQYGRGNPMAFLILPFLPSFQRLLPSFRRRVLVDAGAAGFMEGTKWLLDMYSRAAPFSDAFLIDPRLNENEIPLSYRQAINFSLFERLIRVGTREESTDLLSMLASESWGLSEHDFVVLKFDCDRGDDGDDKGVDSVGSIEWGFLADLVYHPEYLKFVDEIFIEMHFFYPSHWGTFFSTHSMWQHFDVLRQLRAHGIPIHAWP